MDSVVFCIIVYQLPIYPRECMDWDSFGRRLPNSIFFPEMECKMYSILAAPTTGISIAMI